MACGDLSSPTREPKLRPPRKWKHRAVTTGPPGSLLVSLILLKYIWCASYASFRSSLQGFCTCMWSEMVSAVSLVTIRPTQTYYIAGPFLTLWSWACDLLITGRLSPQCFTPPVPFLPAAAHSLSVSMSLSQTVFFVLCFRLHIWDHTVICFSVWLISLSVMPSRSTNVTNAKIYTRTHTHV